MKSFNPQQQAETSEWIDKCDAGSLSVTRDDQLHLPLPAFHLSARLPAKSHFCPATLSVRACVCISILRYPVKNDIQQCNVAVCPVGCLSNSSSFRVRR